MSSSFDRYRTGRVCRLCLQTIKGSQFSNINAVETQSGFMPYRDQLTTCIPEIALDLIPNPLICNPCRMALRSAYDFKNHCLRVEEKIREYVEEKGPYANVDLSEVTLDFGPKPTTIPEPEAMEIVALTNPIEPPQIEPEEDCPNDSMVEDEISYYDNIEDDEEEEDDKEDVIEVPAQLPAEVPIIKDEEIETISDSGEADNSQDEDKEDEDSGPFKCDKCDREFSFIEQLYGHKSVHASENEFLCNFCNRSFKSLQYLRKHNTVCSKEQKLATTPTNANMLAKRPHLPAKAKNHLKHWLFKHTHHPYPTDQEKQVLMKETNLTLLQVENWFINARRRILQDLTRIKAHSKFKDFMELHSEIQMAEATSTNIRIPGKASKLKKETNFKGLLLHAGMQKGPSSSIKIGGKSVKIKKEIAPIK